MRDYTVLDSPEPALETMLRRYFSPSLPAGALPEQLATGMIRGSSARAVADGARGLAARPDSRDLLPTIDVPALVIVGEHDALTPVSDAQELATRMPNARLEVIDQAGHMSNLENPEAVKRRSALPETTRRKLRRCSRPDRHT